MSFAQLIPTTFAALGSILIGLAIVLVLVDAPGGVPWKKIAAWCAFLGGAGVLGGAGGWIGSHIISGSQSALSWLQKWAATAIGVGALVVVLLGLGLWAFAHLKGKGVEAGGGGKGSKRVRALLKAGAFALIGAAVFAAIPQLYTVTDWAVATVGGGIRNGIRNLAA